MNAASSTLTGALWGYSVGALLYTIGTHLVGGPVAPVATLSIFTFTILPGASLGLLAHFERTQP